MPAFAYVAMKADGRPATGKARAADRDAAEAMLRGRGLLDLEVTEQKGLLQSELMAKKVKRVEIMHLSRQLGAFIHAGLPLVDAVHTLGAESGNSSVRRMMAEVENRLRAGDTLSNCFDAHPKIFPEYYRGILRSAELSGELDTVLDQLSKYLERDEDARRKIKSAMVYPSIIAGMAVVVVVVLSVFVLPKFKVFFASLNATLPLPTRMLLAATDFFGQWWWAMLIGVLTLVLAFFIGVRTSPGRYARDRMVLAMPVVGDTVQFALVERFCRILASMVAAGVPLPQALQVSTDSLRNVVFSRALADVENAMFEGEGLATPLIRTGLFPATAAQMLRVGEETGTLDTQLKVTARYYEGELDYKIKKLTSLIEPVVIIAMGGVVGFVAIALVSAMYGVFGQVAV
ncbi:MAG: type II secretion system F family protein [Dermatophilaceae bacterium]|nr:type II secretion system F family protein [Dermatophilaceae bacterium]